MQEKPKFPTPRVAFKESEKDMIEEEKRQEMETFHAEAEDFPVPRGMLNDLLDEKKNPLAN